MSVVWSGMCQIFVLAMVKNSHQILVKFFFGMVLCQIFFFFCEKFSSDSRQVFFVLMKFFPVLYVTAFSTNTSYLMQIHTGNQIRCNRSQHKYS